jgi:hypothetical protein
MNPLVNVYAVAAFQILKDPSNARQHCRNSGAGSQIDGKWAAASCARVQVAPIRGPA